MSDLDPGPQPSRPSSIAPSVALAALTELASAEDAEAAQRAATRARIALGGEAGELDGLIERLTARASEIESLRQLAGSDALTGAANRRAFGDALGREIARMDRGARGPAVVLFDLDGLKAINDTHGHAAGDAAIAAAVEALTVGARGTDMVARLGGDELAVLLPETDEASARQATERLRDIVESRRVRGVRLQTSVGFAVTRRGMDADTLLAFADAKLYADKRARRASGLGDGEAERAAASGGALHGERPAVRLDDALADRQPETRAA